MSIAILGFGIEGKSTYSFLTEQQGISPQEITVLDANEDASSLHIPKDTNAQVGDTYLEDLSRFDQIRRSPGFTTKKLKEQLGEHTDRDTISSKLISQTDYFFEKISGSPTLCIGVSGTKGKSTTVSFLKTLLDLSSATVSLVGNIGTPVFDEIDFENLPDIVIYELSSYMLESLDLFQTAMKSENISIDYGVLTTLSEAHVGSHGGKQQYIDAKFALLQMSKEIYLSDQARNSSLYTNKQKTLLNEKRAQKKCTIYGSSGRAFFDGKNFLYNRGIVCSDQGFAPLGTHMRRNISVGLSLIADLKAREDKTIIFPEGSFQQALQKYTPLPHRLQNIGTYGSIRWINDSFATTTNSVAACIRSLGSSLETIFLGGYDNQTDPDEIVQSILQSGIKNIILFPTTDSMLKERITIAYAQAGKIDEIPTFFQSKDITESIRWAYTVTTPGSFAALSCGYPSFTMRNNYVHRGEDFSETVIRLEKECGPV